MKLNREQIEILDHTVNRSAGGFYCGGSDEMDALLDCGLMEYAGMKSFAPDKYYKITSKGRKALRSANQQIE